ncbi:Helicase associated domain protein [Streptomyces roseoverticillatus]|uniref:DEAD/DEAH box helicase n=1 Tax=Streptomyces roseoverticillatus TaxID=66429 RepID=UPI001F44A48E|nr:DEAD/DEAH box helicase [Streptomyces roseoverticillatus]MCF3105331.1 Helicase associated domain protein [Streptomyces roseoverticillatus]
MPGKELFPHQVEAVDAILRVLQTPADGHLPAEGLRTQVIAATGSGKTLIATEAAQKLGARRVLVLVPTLDLLTQTAAAWREGGRTGAMIGVCRLTVEDSDGMPCTTDPAELVAWAQGLERVTVFATYAAVGLGILQRAHAQGLGVWDLMVVDEAHRTSGEAGKPWAAVHDQGKIPAARRLYMTATARIWQATGSSRDEEPRLIASMNPDSPLFGPVAFKLTLSDAISRGLVAPYQVVCVDITDPELHQAQQTAGPGSDAVRGARLAALQTGVLTAAAREGLRKVLAFHSKVSEAEAMAGGVIDVARRLWQDDPRRFPAPERVWADWLYGDHAPSHRRAVLTEFASDVIEDHDRDGGGPRLRPAALRVLSSVRVLGEGVDTANCDSVIFCDARGSMVDIVQMVGRALRMKPGEGKIASLIVPVFLAPGESPDEILTSPAYEALAKVLGALRAHDTDTIEALADPRVRSGSYQPEEETGEDRQERPEDERGPSAPARELLRFSAPRDPALLARFVKLRVIEPENAFWRRGIEACVRYVKETGAEQLRVPYGFVTPEDWVPAGFPLGTWLADQRRFNKAGRLAAARVAELDGLGMVWSHLDVAFEEGLAAARAWAAVHGHFLPPATAVWDGYPVGTWAKNQRTAARIADTVAEQRAAGLPVRSGAKALAEARREALEEIDPGWCPVWDTGWQRCFRLAQAHIEGGGAVPTVPGEVIVQGEDLGRWAWASRLAWDALMPVQQWLLENILGLTPAEEHERPVKHTQEDKWALNLRAAFQYHAREGHLNVPRKHTEMVGNQPVKLGTFIDNARRRADKLTPQRRADLNTLGIRW